MHKVFVYGTLRGHAEDQTLWRIPGMAIFDLGPYPAVVENRYHSTIGQIIECDDETLEDFDRYEGVGKGLYTRERANALRVDGTAGVEDVWVYVAGPGIQNYINEQRYKGIKLRIASGDWYERN